MATEEGKKAKRGRRFHSYEAYARKYGWRLGAVAALGRCGD